MKQIRLSPVDKLALKNSTVDRYGNAWRMVRIKRCLWKAEVVSGDFEISDDDDDDDDDDDGNDDQDHDDWEAWLVLTSVALHYHINSYVPVSTLFLNRISQNSLQSPQACNLSDAQTDAGDGNQNFTKQLEPFREAIALEIAETAVCLREKGFCWWGCNIVIRKQLKRTATGSYCRLKLLPNVQSTA